MNKKNVEKKDKPNTGRQVVAVLPGKAAKIKYTQDEVEQAIKSAGGYLAHAAEILKCPLDTLKKQINESKYLRNVLIEVKESCLDYTETKLFEKIKDGNLLAIMFYLKCQGQDRGWMEKPNSKAGDSSSKPLYIKLVPVGMEDEKRGRGRPKKAFSEVKVLPGVTPAIGEFIDAKYEDA